MPSLAAMSHAHHDLMWRDAERLSSDLLDDPSALGDRSAVLGLRRILLRLHALLVTHLAEEELYIPILEDRLTPGHEAALARALDHLAAEPL